MGTRCDTELTLGHNYSIDFVIEKRWKIMLKHIYELGGTPGLVVMGGGSLLEVVSSNPSAVYWMDTFHIYLF